MLSQPGPENRSSTKEGAAEPKMETRPRAAREHRPRQPRIKAGSAVHEPQHGVWLSNLHLAVSLCSLSWREGDPAEPGGHPRPMFRCEAPFLKCPPCAQPFVHSTCVRGSGEQVASTLPRRETKPPAPVAAARSWQSWDTGLQSQYRLGTHDAVSGCGCMSCGGRGGLEPGCP